MGGERKAQAEAVVLFRLCSLGALAGVYGKRAVEEVSALFLAQSDRQSPVPAPCERAFQCVRVRECVGCPRSGA